MSDFLTCLDVFSGLVIARQWLCYKAKNREDGRSAECGVTSEDVLPLEVLLKILGLGDSNQKDERKKVQRQNSKLFFLLSYYHCTFWTPGEELALNNSNAKDSK